MNDSDSDLTARARRVADAIASSRLEGLELPPSTLADLVAYAEGRVYTSNEEAKHARREYLEQMSTMQMVAQCTSAQGRRWVAQTVRAVLPRASLKIRDVRAVPHNQPLDIPGGLVPLALNGHTPGHTGWLLPSRGILFSGDSLVTHHALSARPTGPQFLPSGFNFDEQAMVTSLRAVRDLPVDVLVPGHGPVHRGSIADAVDLAVRNVSS